MSFLKKNCSEPINIPNSNKFNNIQNFRYVSLRQYKNYECEVPDYSNSPNKNITSITLKKCIYSSDRFGPDGPLGKTPPNKDSFKKMYMEMFANIHLNYVSPK